MTITLNNIPSPENKEKCVLSIFAITEQDHCDTCNKSIQNEGDLIGLFTYDNEMEYALCLNCLRDYAEKTPELLIRLKYVGLI